MMLIERQGRARRGFGCAGSLVPALIGIAAVAAAILVLVADNPALARALGIICFLSSLVALWRLWIWGGVTDHPSVAACAPVTDLSQMFGNAADPTPSLFELGNGTGTSNDYQTAMGLFGAVIMDQVENSVTAVVQENQQMREMAGEMSAVAQQANTQFGRSMSVASNTEDCIERLVRRQNIRHSSWRKLAECGPRLGFDVRRRPCGEASADVRWSVA